MEETTSTATLTPPHLPFDLVTKILCLFPVKHLLRLRCICKSWNSLISDDSNFARKHLRLSTSNHDRHHLTITSRNSSGELLLRDYPISSIFSSVSPTHATQFSYPLVDECVFDGVTTCDGMLCFRLNRSLALLCNPSIRKFKMLPPLNTPEQNYIASFTLVYDRFSHNYKIIALIIYHNIEKEVNIHTLGTDYWRKIQDLPYDNINSPPGIFVSDTVNWFRYDDTCTDIIVSLDLEKESYQTLWSPLQDIKFKVFNTLGVLRDCLCILSHPLISHKFSHFWIMKEYGNEQSWTKLFSIPHIEDGIYYHCNALYISEDDQVVLEFLLKTGIKKSLLIYDSLNNTSKIPQIQNIDYWLISKIYV